jgi:putative aldouronate transport system substrate-binding protein
MKMSKKANRFLVLLVAVLMSVSLIGCASTASPSAAATQSAAAESAEAAETAAATDAAAPAATEGSVAGTLPISKDPISLAAFWPAPANVLKFIQDFNEASIWPVIEKQTNIHINWQHGTLEQFNLMINSGEVADIVFAPDSNYIYPGGGEKAVSDGMYLKLNDYLDKYCMWYPKLINSTPEFKRDS